VKTLGSRSSASLPLVTAADHFCGDPSDGARPAALAADGAAFAARLRVPEREVRDGRLEAVRFAFFNLPIQHLRACWARMQHERLPAPQLRV
jgi:hypothetical protein